jgi:(p)ppGpp synthase/HD superfamily hydrolase
MSEKKNIWDREKYIKAWNFSSLHHSGQKYGSSKQDLYIDYLTHIGMVCMEIIWALQNSNEEYNADLAIQCAILHDIIEDTEIGYTEILSKFGKPVADGVLALSKNGELETKDLQMKDSLNRIKLQPREIWMVKMADRISNLNEAPFYWDNEKILKYRYEAQLIHDSLSTANSILAQRLKLKINEYCELNKKNQ